MPRKPKNPFHIDTTTAAELFETTPKTISEWEKAAGKERKSFKVSYGVYHLRKLFSWWLENIYSPKQEGSTIQDARERYWNAKADGEEISVKKLRGELIPQEAVVDQWCKRVAEVKQGLLSLPVKLPPVLEGKRVAEMRGIIKGEVFRLLDGYAREGKYCPTDAGEAPR